MQRKIHIPKTHRISTYVGLICVQYICIPGHSWPVWWVLFSDHISMYVYCSAGRVHSDTLAERLQVWDNDGSTGAGSPARPGLCHTHEHWGEETATQYIHVLCICMYMYIYSMYVKVVHWVAKSNCFVFYLYIVWVIILYVAYSSLLPSQGSAYHEEHALWAEVHPHSPPHTTRESAANDSIGAHV